VRNNLHSSAQLLAQLCVNSVTNGIWRGLVLLLID